MSRNLVGWLLLGAGVGALWAWLDGEDAEGIATHAGAFALLAWWLRSSAKRTPIKAALVAAAAVAAVGGFLYWGSRHEEVPGFLWRDIAVEFRPVTALKGVALGQPTSEVGERLGVRVQDREGRVRSVSYECQGFDPTRVNRIGCHQPERRVLEVFGHGARRLCSRLAASDPRETLAAQRFALDVLDTGTRYLSDHGQVRGFVIMAPEELEHALDGEHPWQRC